MASAIDFPPKPGEVVRVRSRRYLVEDVEPPPTPGDQTLVLLSCLEDDAEGEEVQVLWEKEVDAQRINEADWSRLAGGEFDAPHLFAAYYRTLRWNAVTSTDPKLFQAPYRAGIRIDAYQLEPLRKALLLPRVNLFIADDVGLGNSPSELQVRQYPQAVALALVLRHSWRADDLACILARLGVRHGSSLKKIQAGQVERRQKRHGTE